MLRARLVRTAAAAGAMSLVLVACGQKPGVHVEGAGNNLGGGGGIAAPVTNPDGTVTDPGTTGGTSGGTTGGTSGGTTGGTSGGTTGGTTGGTSGGTTGGTSGGGGGTAQVTGSDRTGASEEAIRIGIHAPVTGAAPLPSTSFEKAGPLYWKHVTETLGQTVLGRKNVEVIFRDDKYDPSSARQVCRELASEVFLGVGGGGTDQIAACGAFANLSSWPYFSAGVTEAGLTDNPWYFASSMSYRQQTDLLAQWVSKQHAGKKVAAIFTDTPNFDDAIQGWEAAQAKYGLNYYKTLKHGKGDASWYSSFVSEMQDNNVEVIFLLTSPVDYIRFAQKATENSYGPQYVGVGISKGLNAVLGSGCGNNDVDGGEFLSPFPGLDWARQNLPEFFAAADKFGLPKDDISLALWGINRSAHEMFNAYGNTFGNDLTREDFRALTETLTIETGVFPTVQYSPQNHFGGTGMHMLRANCSTKEHETVAAFASAF